MRHMYKAFEDKVIVKIDSTENKSESGIFQGAQEGKVVHTVVDAVGYKDLIGKEIYSDKVVKLENGYGSVKLDDILAIVWDN